jgi:membrane protease YdiL (CAAX protease family)
MLQAMRATLHPAFVGLTGGLGLVAYLFPYFEPPGLWWRAIPSTVAILGLGALVYGKGALRFFGLRMSRRQLLLSVSVFLVGLLLFRTVVLPLITNQSLTVTLGHNPLGYVHQFFQVFNDELVLRAALLTLLLRAFPHPKTIVITTAVLFAVGHHVVYRMNGVFIEWPALLSLFSFGAIVNLLFVRFGHIGYGVALHYAWNFYRFNSVYALDGRLLSEGMTFNYIEGSPWVVLGSVVAFAITLLAYVKFEGVESRGRHIALGDTAQHEHPSD